MEDTEVKPNTDFLQPPCVGNGKCSFQNVFREHHVLLRDAGRKHETHKCRCCCQGTYSYVLSYASGQHSETTWSCTGTQLLGGNVMKHKTITFPFNFCAAWTLQRSKGIFPFIPVLRFYSRVFVHGLMIGLADLSGLFKPQWFCTPMRW